jgi:hypothetical protein
MYPSQYPLYQSPEPIPMVINSSDADDMFPFSSMFEQITYFDTKNRPVVLLMDDDNKALSIARHRYATNKLHDQVIWIHTLNIPNMSNTVLFLVK